MDSSQPQSLRFVCNLDIPNCIAKHNGVAIGQKVYCISAAQRCETFVFTTCKNLLPRHVKKYYIKQLSKFCCHDILKTTDVANICCYEKAKLLF